MGILIYKSIHRQLLKSDWLNSYETFNSDEKGFLTILHIYEHHLKAALGFPITELKNVEVISIILSGGLSHQDNQNNLSINHVGDAQLVSAGKGIIQSELNASDKNELVFLQIYMKPEKLNIDSQYQRKSFDTASNLNEWRLIISKDGREGSLQINQDSNFFLAKLSMEGRISHSFEANRSGWLQIIKGTVELNNQEMGIGDAAAITEIPQIEIRAHSPSEILLITQNSGY